MKNQEQEVKKVVRYFSKEGRVSKEEVFYKHSDCEKKEPEKCFCGIPREIDDAKMATPSPSNISTYPIIRNSIGCSVIGATIGSSTYVNSISESSGGSQSSFGRDVVVEIVGNLAGATIISATAYFITTIGH